MARMWQSGSATGFVFVGALMAILLIGGVFLVRQQTIQAATSNQGAVSEPSVQQKSEPEKSQEKETVAQEQAVDSSASVKSVELPKTGVSDMLGSVATLSILSYLVVSYIRSRRFGLSL